MRPHPHADKPLWWSARDQVHRRVAAGFERVQVDPRQIQADQRGCVLKSAAENGRTARGYRQHTPGTQPEYLSPAYISSERRAPSQPLIVLPHTLSELTGPVFGQGSVGANDSDLTAQHAGEPIGERIVVHGRVLDDAGRPVPNALVEVWQANAAGRYRHRLDQHDAPLDPNFSGAGRLFTGADGTFEFKTIKPGAYPWGNHFNAWRPAHIHFSLFGAGLLSRLVTQMYFPGDPLQKLDPIFNSIDDHAARGRLISRFDIERTQPSYALAYNFDIVLRGPHDTPFETR